MSLALVLDLDDTLYPERAYNFSGFRAVGRHLAAQHGISGFADCCVALFESGARGDIFDQALARLGVTADVAELLTVYREHVPEITLFEDARTLFERVRGKLPLALLTDGYAAVQRRKVAALGIADHFAARVFSDDEGREAWKPSPLPYLRVMNLLAQKAEEFIYVGDNPAKDFVTARKLGWQTVWVCRPGAVHQVEAVAPGFEADIVIKSLTGLPWHRYGL
ncbi:MAG: hypothetical protein RJA63_3966 [Pseudomonadota bacterium]|jgi:putative hydrolase of the HAD superfamily